MDSRFKTASPPVKTEKGMPSPLPGPARDTAEYDRIMQPRALRAHGREKRTASELGISLATLYRRMGQLGITARKHAR
ncbi:MAG: helix-turn-helix domain-containing protein [Bilophila wadsworthia]